jgi:hypothetical protein
VILRQIFQTKNRESLRLKSSCGHDFAPGLLRYIAVSRREL